MNIAIFTNSYKPTVSGVVRSIEVIKNSLTNLGENIYIFAPYHKKAIKENGVYRFPSINISDKLDFPIPLPISGKLNKIIKNLNLDIIHTQHPFLLGNFAIKIAKQKKIPVVYTFHTQYEQYSHYAFFLPQKFLKNIIKKLVINYINKVDTVIAPSESIKNVLKNYNVKTNIEYIPNAIDIEKFKNVDEKKLNQIIEKYNLKNKKTLIFVGRMAKEKNLFYLIDVIELILKERKDVFLLLIGDGPIKDNLLNYIKEKKLDKYINITGKIPYNEIPIYYKLAYAFVSASTTEVKPLALLESLAAGLPIVAVNAFGAKDNIVNNYNGILTEIDKNALKNGILRLLDNNSLHKELSLNALQSSNLYSQKNFAKKLKALYEKLINEKRTKL